MKVVNSYIFRAVCALFIGIFLVVNPDRMTVLLVQVIGGLFILSGILTLISYFIIRNSNDLKVKPVFPVVALGSFLFGAILGFFPEFFIDYLMLLLGVLMVLAGLNQLWNMFRMRRIIPFRWYVFLMTLMVVALGVWVVCFPKEASSIPFILMGINMLVYGISELVNGVRWRKYNKTIQPVAYVEVVEDETENKSE